MTDREKLVYLIKENAKAIVSSTENGVCVCLDVEALADHLLSHGVTVREPQKPLTVEELTRLPKVVYIECTFFVEIHAALPDRLCGTPPCLGIQFVHAYEKFKLDKYGKTWRCWAEKPTEEERKAAEWEK